jgi:ATP-binding cassette subfamily F protein uup
MPSQISNQTPQTVILKAIDISLHFGQKTILDNVTFEIKTKEIIGVVGRNGSGKSSFLKLLAGFYQADSGKMEFKVGAKVGYIPQEVDLEGDLTVFETIAKSWFEYHRSFESDELQFVADLLDKAEPWKHLDFVKHEFVIQNIIETLQKLLGPGLEAKISSLSGGEKRKVAIAAKLVFEPDVIILDEPTNHLDIASMEALEAVIKAYSGAVILVSHDRYFLDRLATRMIEVFDGKMYQHSGNYQKYLLDKAKRQEIAGIEEDRKQAFLKREIEWVRAGVQGRGVKDKGRLDRYYTLKNSKSTLQEQALELLLPPIRPLSNKILNFEEFSLQIKDKKIVQNLNFTFQPGFRLGLIGDNGSGKTSIIKAILSQTNAHQANVAANFNSPSPKSTESESNPILQTGKIIIGQNTIFNYQDQEKAALNLENTLFEEIGQGQESTKFGEGMISTRGYLRRLQFSNQQIMTKIKHFSGGERARVLLAKVLIQGGNFLILDEPTNDLDLETIRLLEESLLEFQGVAIIVSHDRYFLNRVCNYVLALEKNGKHILNSGNFEDFVARRKPIQPTVAANFNSPTLETESNDSTDATNPTQPPKPQISFRDIKIRDRAIKNLEKQIDTQEKELKKVEKELAAFDFSTQKLEKITEKMREYEAIKAKINTLTEEWAVVAG